jgi:hypothetical protein
MFLVVVFLAIFVAAAGATASIGAAAAGAAATGVAGAGVAAEAAAAPMPLRLAATAKLAMSLRVAFVVFLHLYPSTGGLGSLLIRCDYRKESFVMDRPGLCQGFVNPLHWTFQSLAIFDRLWSVSRFRTPFYGYGDVMALQSLYLSIARELQPIS